MSEHSQEQDSIQHCYNCHKPIAPQAKYCSSCGQKHTDGKITVKELFIEFFEIVFNLDNKIFRTMGGLVIPGKLTEDYFQGKIRRYFHPLRIFFILGLLMIICLTSSLRTIENQITDQIERNTSESYGFFLALQEVEELAEIWKEKIPEPGAALALDSLVEGLSNSPLHESDTIELDEISVVNFDDSLDIKIARKDMMDMPIDTIYEVYEINGFWNRLLVRQQIRFLTQGSKYISFMIGNVIWAMVLMMPVLALLLKLFYIRRKYYYVEHLIFAYHTHAFLFLLLSITLLLTDWLGGLIWILFGIILIPYFYIALRRVYKQGWIKTAIKSFLLWVFYTIISITFILAMILLGFLFF